MTGRARTARVTGPIAVALGLALSLSPGCKKTPTLDFALSLPSDVASKVAWYEVGVFTGQSCTTLGPQLSGGVPATGYLERIAFEPSNPTPPLLQNLPRAKYSIAVAARAADCSVLAIGCDDVDLTSAKSVDVTLDDTAKPAQGACISGTLCNDGRCTPASNGSPTAGAGCSLALVGAGPLADPLLAVGGTVVSAPAIAATDRGFLIAYREDDQPDGVARVTVIPVDVGGAALTPQQVQQAACSQTELNDATGIVFAGTAGVVAEARPGCGGNGGVDLYAISDTGTIGKTGFTSEGMDRLQLSAAHALAQSSAGTFVAYLQANTATVAPVNDLALGTASTFGGGERASDAWIAASDGAVALVAAGTSDGTVVTPDAGAAQDDGGDGEGGIDASAPAVDATVPAATGGVLRVNVVAAANAAASFGSLPAPDTFPGNWASVSALAGRVFVASDGQTADQPIAFRAYDMGTTAPTLISGFTTGGTGPVLYTDVAFHQDHVFFAVERQGSIALVAYEHATTTPTLLRTIALASDARVPSMTGVRDGRVAVLATDTRVLVAWTTEETLTFNDPTGGYALFACTTP